MEKKNKITEGVIWKEVIFFFIPIVLSAFFQHLYTIVDGVIVGRTLGDVAFSAVGGSASKLIVLLINFFVGVSSGVTAYASRFYGKNDMRAVGKTVYNGSLIFIALGTILSIVGIIKAPNLLGYMNTPTETMQDASLYLRTFLCGLVFCVLYNVFAGVFRAIGNAKIPLIILIFCSITNIVLDIVFVIVFQLGVQGVATATMISQGISALILGVLLWRKIPMNKESCCIELIMIRDICRIGIPVGIQSIMYSLSNIMIQSVINGFGYVSVSAWAAYVKLDNIVDIFVSSLASTVITFVGQNFGAGKIKRMKESVKQIMVISYVVTGALFLGFVALRYPLLSMFTRNHEVVEIGASLMFIIMPMYLLGIPYQIFAQALRGVGKSFVPMMITLVGIVGIRVIWANLIFPLNPTLSFLGICYPLSSILMSLIFSVYYKIEMKQFKE